MMFGSGNNQNLVCGTLGIGIGSLNCHASSIPYWDTIAIGYRNCVACCLTRTIGCNNYVCGCRSFVFGNDSCATGTRSTVIGDTSCSPVDRAIVLGHCSFVNQACATVIGSSSCSTHCNAVVIGSGLSSQKENTVHVNNLISYGQGASVAHVIGNTGGTVVLDWDNSNVQTLTLTSNVTTLTKSNPINGGVYTLFVTQDSGTLRTVNWGADVKWAGGTGPTLTGGTGATDAISMVYIAGVTGYYANANLNFA
jgi:hypothetical protein